MYGLDQSRPQLDTDRSFVTKLQLIKHHLFSVLSFLAFCECVQVEIRMIHVFGMVWDAQLDNLILLSFFFFERTILFFRISLSLSLHQHQKISVSKKKSKNIRTIQWVLVIYCLAFIGKQPRMPPTSFEVILCRK